MTHFGSDVQYAVYILLDLAAAPPKAQVSPLEFADSLRLPVVRIHKLLANLERAGLVSRIRALDGGWRLSSPPKRVSILAVIEAVQDYRPLFQSEETDLYGILSYTKPAARRGFFGLHAIMLEAERKMLDALARRTLDDIRS
jgi:Rrf2 family protein